MYVTYYTLNVYGPDADSEALDKYIEEEAKKGTLDEWVEKFFVDGYCEGRWNTKYEDMKKISEAFPTLLFHIEGSGEEVEDLWKERWKNGESEYIHVEWPPFTNPRLII